MRLASTLENFYDVYGNTVTPAQAVSCYAQTGFKYLDFSFRSSNIVGFSLNGNDTEWKTWVCDAGEEAAKHGLRFVQAHYPNGSLYRDMDTFVRLTDRAIQGCGMLGIPNIVLHVQVAPGSESLERYNRTIETNKEFIRRLMPQAQRQNVTILLENTGDVYSPGPAKRDFPCTATELIEVIRLMDSSGIKVCWDVGHAHLQELDQYSNIRQLDGVLDAIHIHDNVFGQDIHTAPFFGTLNFDSIMQALLDGKFPGYFTFEAINTIRNPRTDLLKRGLWREDDSDCTRLMRPSLPLKVKVAQLIYEIGKYILETYDCFEE